MKIHLALGRRVLACLLLAAAPAYSIASAPAPEERAAVLAVVQQFFDCLAKHDGATLQTLVAPGSQVSVAPETTPAPRPFRRRTAEEDAAGISAGKDAWLERMWEPTVLLDERIAVVWTPYDFHLNGKFSHNGIDVFTLMKLEGRWKIISTAYTRELGGTSRHPAGPPQ